MSLKYIRNKHGVPAFRGARVRFTGNGKPLEGSIVSAREGRIAVVFDGFRNRSFLHPTWMVEYLPKAENVDADNKAPA